MKPGDPVVRFDTSGLASSIESAQDSLKAKWEERSRKRRRVREPDLRAGRGGEEGRERQPAKGPRRVHPRGARVAVRVRPQAARKEDQRSRPGQRPDEQERQGGATWRARSRSLAIEARSSKPSCERLKDGLDDLTLYRPHRRRGDLRRRRMERPKGPGGRHGLRHVDGGHDPRPVVAPRPGLDQRDPHPAHQDRAERRSLLSTPTRTSRYKGAIRGISKSADPVRRWGRSSYFRVEIDLDKLEPDIMKPGMSVRCEVRGPELQGRPSRPAGDDPFRRTAPSGSGPPAAKPVKLAALDYDEFAVAADAGGNPAIKAGMTLAPVGALPKDAGETKSA